MSLAEAYVEPKSGDLLGEGRYRLDVTIGKGATALVWRAHDTVLGVDRAVKVLHTRFGASKSIRARLLAEARAMAKLRHPNILGVHDISFNGNVNYVIMDLADQGSLADWTDAHGPMPPDMAVAAMIQVLSALSAAHRHGIVHRDVKPQNILRDAQGTCLLADFGIARLAEDALRSTRTGVAMGSLAFMAPEQRLDARSVTEAADLYAAGTTLYNLLTTSNPVDLFAADPTSSRWSSLSPSLAEIIRRAVAYDPGARFASAPEMGEALVGVLPTLSTTATPAPKDLPRLGGDPADRALRATPPVVDLRARPRVVDQAVTLMFTVNSADDPSGSRPTPGTLLPESSLGSSNLDHPDDDALDSLPVELPPESERLALPPDLPPEPRSARIGRLLAVAVILLLAVAGGGWLSQRGTSSRPEAGTVATPAGPTDEATPAPTGAAGTGADAEQRPPDPPGPDAIAVAPEPVAVAAIGPEEGRSTGAGSAPRTASTPPTADTPSQGAPEAEVPTTPRPSGSSPVAGTWAGNVHSQRATLVLDGEGASISGRLTLKHPSTGIARTVSVVGAFDSAARRLQLEEQVDPEVDPTAGRYDATLSTDGMAMNGTYSAIRGSRTATIALRRSER